MSETRPRATLQPTELRSRDGHAYTLLESIGAGATGTVYRAVDRGLDGAREVCVKRLSADVNPRVVGGLLEEARLLSRLRHANVVSLLGVGQEESGLPFLVLELVSGSDLRALSRSLVGAVDGPGTLPWRLAVHVACALLRALGAVQRTLPGLVHRDVTPHNVLVSTEGEVKLADFGIALTRERASWHSQSVISGKVGYMAPEQARGDAIDVRADLFSVGIVLYELLAGRRPVGSSAPASLGERGRAFDGLCRRRPDLPRPLLLGIDRLLAPHPDDRFDGPDHALRELAVHGAGELGSLRMAALVRSSASTATRSASTVESSPGRRSTLRSPAPAARAAASVRSGGRRGRSGPTSA